MVRTLLQPFYTAYVVLSFLICLFAAFPIFLLVSIPNNHGSRRVMWKIIRYWSIGWLWIIGMPVRRKGKLPEGDKYVIVANHISYLDTIVIFPAIPFYFRALGKYETAKVPLLGFIYRQMVILVKRDSAHNRARSMRLMWRLLKKESSIIIFPEGTFNETGAPLKEFTMALSGWLSIHKHLYGRYCSLIRYIAGTIATGGNCGLVGTAPYILIPYR